MAVRVRTVILFVAAVIPLVLIACSTSASAPPVDSSQVEAPAAAVTPTVASPPQSEASEKPAYCVAEEKYKLQEIKSTPASPYFVHHPASDNPAAPTVIFIPGGPGSRRGAQRVWSNFLSNGRGVEAFRAVIPYSVDIDFIDQASRTYRILDEVLACYGGDASKIHIAGTSNGGLAAFALMQARPELFDTLLGAPGAFPRQEPEEWVKALAGHAVFNGVGANDDEWKPDVKAIHDALTAAGIESVYVEFESQGHSVSEEFDESVFFEFWASH